MIKKPIVIILLLILSASLGACGGDGGDTASNIPDDTKITFVDAVELDTLHEDIEARSAIISPDASTIIWTGDESGGVHQRE